MKLSDPGTLAFPKQVVELLQVLAFFYLQNNRPQQAVDLLKAADQAGGCRGQALLVLALAQLRTGCAETALATLDRVHGRHALEPSHHAIRAQVLTTLGRQEDAQAAMRAYLQAKAAADTPAPQP